MINPKILKGTRDFLPADMAKRNLVMNIIRQTFERFGYDTIETPAIEYAETLLGKYGDEGSQLTYRFQDNGNRDIALRYDQTVPFARLVAANYQNLPMPFKRYQIDRVWRADRPAKGRYREFYQCDIDIIGTTSLIAEAEIAKVMFDVFKNLGFKKFTIKFNSRRLLNSILISIGIAPDQQMSVIRIIDKLDKLGPSKLKKELKTILSNEATDQLIKAISITGSNQEKINQLKAFDTSEIETFLKYSRPFGIDEQNLQFDLSLARGLDYYTGLNYEVFIDDLELGAVCGGGRYDDLCGMFSIQKFSGVGVAFGFDRIILAMEELSLLNEVQLNTQALVVNFDEAGLENSLTILSELQVAQINSEIYFEPDKLSRQFKYADKKQIPFVVMAGSDEQPRSEVTIKSMVTGTQKTIPQSQLIDYLKGYV